MKFVFDFAGVLFHWQPQQMLRRLLPHVARNDTAAAFWEAQIFQAWGGDWADFDRGTVEPAALVQRIAGRTGLAAADVRRVIDAVPHELQPLPATVALLRRLHDAGCALYFLSNMPAPYARHLLAQHAFIGWFKDGIFSADVQLNKPEPALYALAAKRFGQAPQQLVFLDDQPANVAAARACGWNALQFTSAAQAEAEMAAMGWLAAPGTAAAPPP